MFPTDLSSFLDLIRQHGDAAYSFMFAYAASHSPPFGLFAATRPLPRAEFHDPACRVLVRQLHGDVIRFWIGWRFGVRWLGPFPRLERAIRTAAHPSNRHHVWMILLHRYPHGIRGVAGFAYGLSPLPWSTFLVLNFVAAGLWSIAVVSLGYAFGQVSEKVMSDASSGLGPGDVAASCPSWVLSKRLERSSSAAEAHASGRIARRTAAPPRTAGEAGSPCQTGLRSSSSIETPLRSAQEGDAHAGADGVGLHRELCALGLEPATTSSMPVTASPKWSSP